MVVYYPIDRLAVGAGEVRAGVRARSAAVMPLEASYLDGLRQVADSRAPGQTLLALFLGSTIGNFEPEAAIDFLLAIRLVLQPGDALLLGTDLVKPLRADDHRLRRSDRRHRGVQPESAGAHQSRTGRRFRPAAVRARRPATTKRRSASRCTCARSCTRS